MAAGLFKKVLFNVIWRILEDKFPDDYSKKVEEEAKNSSAYKDMQANLGKSESDNRILNVRVMNNQSTREAMIQEMKKQRVYYQRQIANKEFILEEARQYVSETIIQGVIDSKKINGLENLIFYQRARIHRDKNDIPTVLGSLFSKPPFRKIPVLIVHNKGHVYYQNPVSRLKFGDLRGRNLGYYHLDCANPNKQDVVLEKNHYTAWVLPLYGGREFDYSVVYLKPASMFGKLKYASEKEMNRAIEVIRAEMAAQLARAGKKKPLRHHGS